MKTFHTRAMAAAALCAITVSGVVACAKDSTESSSGTTAPAMTGPAMTGPAMTGPAMTGPAMTGGADPAANLVGDGCAAYLSQVPSGPGSAAANAQDPVATAIANNPMLKTFSSALSGQFNPEVNLTDSLNNDPSLTVFAPTDDAFAKIGPVTTEKLKMDPDQLTKVLTHHIVEGQLDPSQIVGEHTTQDGAAVQGSGSGARLMINDARVVCGGLKTANATVYMINTVLMP